MSTLFFFEVTPMGMQ